jgi:hypothetical protein
MTRFTDNSFFTVVPDLPTCSNDFSRISVKPNINRMIPLCRTTNFSCVTEFAERGVFIGGTKKKFNQCVFRRFDCMGGMAGGTLHGTIFVQRERVRYVHAV